MSLKAREITFADVRKHTTAERGFLALFGVGLMRLGNRHVVGGQRVSDLTTATANATTDRESAVTCCRTLSGDDVPRNAALLGWLNTCGAAAVCAPCMHAMHA